MVEKLKELSAQLKKVAEEVKEAESHEVVELDPEHVLNFTKFFSKYTG